MKLYDYIDKELLDKMIAERYINVGVHPTLGYRIFNYSKSATFDHKWNDATEKCRGLIVDENDNILARPFKKFYNYEEIEQYNIIPNEIPEKVYEKKDGSLGIMYWTHSCAPKIATRGSFQSEQAAWATKYLNSKLTYYQLESLMSRAIERVGGVGPYFDETLVRVKYTLLFEIVYPEDRHVVNYGDEKSLTLLAVIDNETGEELDPEEFSDLFTVIKSYPVPDDWKKVRDLYKELGESREGFVVKFRNGFRVKLKFEQYFRKHFIMSGLSKKKVFEFISNDDMKGLISMVNLLDEENQIFYKETVAEIWKRYHEIEYEAYLEYKDFETDKEAAFYFKDCKHSGMLFCIRKGKDYSSYIWKKMKPEYKEIPNFVDEDE